MAAEQHKRCLSANAGVAWRSSGYQGTSSRAAAALIKQMLAIPEGKARVLKADSGLTGEKPGSEGT